MKINTNRWNRIRYTLYTPGYDILGKIFSSSRKKAIEKLDLKKGEHVLIVGAGTGLDLEFFPKDCFILATDLTPSMIRKIEEKNLTLKLNLKTQIMDGQNLEIPDQSFDKVILHLILAVIPDPVLCIKEAERVLKINGKISVFDKFVPETQKLSILRKLLNIFTNLFFSDVTRYFKPIAASTSLEIETDIAADFNGNFRIITLKKNP